MDKVQEALKARYSHLHPLVFIRSLEKAKKNGELFDMLHGFPKEYPAVWDEENKCWKYTTDLLQSEKANLKKKEK